jgi:molybdopterin molybdotransferase
MLSIEDALQLVLNTAQPLKPRRVQPCDALGQVLAEDIVSDIDSPPHDKSIVDGYAVIAADTAQPGAELAILEEVTAGAVPTRTVEPGTATRIMTGAPLPRGADAVVMVEQTSLVDGERVRIDTSAVKAGQNIMRRAASLSRGQSVLTAGKRIRAIELGLLAEVGVTQVPIVGRPCVAVLATGNELVDHAATPGPGQIRNSNGPLLKALATQAGADAWELRRAFDTEEDLADRIQSGLLHDVLLITGGVSAGVLDLVPGVLAKLGVEQVFHKVNLKPGKPLWFGVQRKSENGKPCLVFGLPGNPVSSLVCFELFVRPAIERLSGREPLGLPRATAVLTQDHQQRGDRPTYWPAKIKLGVPLDDFCHEFRTALNSIIGFSEVLRDLPALSEQERRYAQAVINSGTILRRMADDVVECQQNRYREGKWTAPADAGIVTPLPWKGSGDLRTLADADGLAYFPPGERLFQAGEAIEVLRFAD